LIVYEHNGNILLEYKDSLFVRNDADKMNGTVLRDMVKVKANHYRPRPVLRVPGG
jgi:hypothetical protein